METTQSLRDATRGWRSATEVLLATAEIAAPLEPEAFSVQMVESGESTRDAEGRIDAQFDALLESSQTLVNELNDHVEGDSDARSRLTSLLLGNLETSDTLLLSTQPPADVFSDLAVEPTETVEFSATRSRLDAFEAGIVGVPMIAGAQLAVPVFLDTKLDELQTTAGTEVCQLATSAVFSIGGTALLDGVGGVLQGSAAAAFDAIRQALTGIVNAIKRGVVKLTNWVVDQLRNLVPAAFRPRLDQAIAHAKEAVNGGIPNVISEALGTVLGRNDVDAAWTTAADNGTDLSGREGDLNGIVASHVARIGWVSTGRKYISRFQSVVGAAVNLAGPTVQIAVGAVVISVFAFLFVQEWDGFNDLEALAS